jgi:hypothetical protein
MAGKAVSAAETADGVVPDSRGRETAAGGDVNYRTYELLTVIRSLRMHSFIIHVAD